MDLMTFLKKYSMKYAKKDSQKDLCMLFVAPIIINTPAGAFLCQMLREFAPTGSRDYVISAAKLFL